MTRLVKSPNRKIQIEIYGRNLKENFSDKIAFFKTDLSTPIRKSWMENIDFFIFLSKKFSLTCTSSNIRKVLIAIFG